MMKLIPFPLECGTRNEHYQTSGTARQPAEMASAVGVQTQGGFLVGRRLNIFTLRPSMVDCPEFPAIVVITPCQIATLISSNRSVFCRPRNINLKCKENHNLEETYDFQNLETNCRYELPYVDNP
jgi:hypothetical protein